MNRYINITFRSFDISIKIKINLEQNIEITEILLNIMPYKSLGICTK